MCPLILNIRSTDAEVAGTPKYFKAHRYIKPWDAITEEQSRQKQLIAEKYANYTTNGGSRFE